MDVTNSDVQFVNFTSVSLSSRIQNSLTVSSSIEKLERVFGVFGLPNKMESILPERMLSGLKFHFFPPTNLTRDTYHSKSVRLISSGLTSEPLFYSHSKELNTEDGNSSLGFKAEIYLPLI